MRTHPAVHRFALAWILLAGCSGADVTDLGTGEDLSRIDASVISDRALLGADRSPQSDLNTGGDRAVAPVDLRSDVAIRSDSNTISDLAARSDMSTGVDLTIRSDSSTIVDMVAPRDGAIGLDATSFDLISTGGDLVGGCSSLASRTSEVSITAGATVANNWPISVAPLPNDSAAIVWSTGSTVYFTRIDAQGNRIGSDVSVPGVSAHGLAVSPTGLASLIRRTPGGNLSDELWLVDVSSSGAVNVNIRLTGGNSPGLTGNSCTNVGTEWFEGFFRRGRILWTGTHYAVYFSLQRCWPDNIAHQGDTFRLYTPAGAVTTRWAWGCSHSLDLRLAQNGSTLAPVCLSDCYDSKAILLSDRTVLSSEPSGNCAGSSTAALGGLVPSGTGYWLTYTSANGRTSADVGLVQFTATGTITTRRFLTQNSTAESAAHLALFGTQLLSGWQASNMTLLQVLDTNGNSVGSVETVTPPLRAFDDLFTYTSGDAGWAYSPGGTQLRLVRVRHCP